MQGSQLMAGDHLIQEGKREENVGHRKERENPVEQFSAKSDSVLLLAASPVQQPETAFSGYKEDFRPTFPLHCHSQDDISHGPGYSCWQVRLGRNQARDTADMPLCVHWAPGGESAHPRHSPQSWCCRTYHTGHREHTAQLSVGISAAPFLHSKSILYGLGPNPAEDAIARRLVTETLLPLGQ